MDRIKKIKIKQQDGTLGDYYPIGADAQNIDFTNGYSLDQIVGNINPDEEGTIEAQLSNIPYICPSNFGAKADGVTDDTVAIQNAINTARSVNKKILFKKGTYLITSSIRVYEGQDIDGNNCTIKGNFDGNLIYCTVSGSITIKNLNLIGANNNEYTNNYGLSMVCYYSTFQNIKISNCYKGMVLDTTGATGTLVENRITDCIFRNNIQSLFLGSSDNNKLTDGFLSNIIVNNKGESSSAIYIGSSAGWVLNNIHIYGKNLNGIAIKNGFHTNIDNIYIEGSLSHLIDCSGTQTDVNISNITGNLTNENNVGIFCQKGGYTPNGNANFNISNVYLAIAADANSSYGIYDGLTAPIIHLSNYKYIKKSSETTFTPIRVQATSLVYDSSNIYITADKKLSNNAYGVLNFGSNPIIQGFSRKIEYQGEKTINIPVYRTLEGYDIIEFNIHLFGKANWDGAKNLEYQSRLYLINKNGTKSVSNNMDINTNPDIFSALPNYTYDSENHQIIMTFTLASSTYGKCFVYMQ